MSKVPRSTSSGKACPPTTAKTGRKVIRPKPAKITKKVSPDPWADAPTAKEFRDKMTPDEFFRLRDISKATGELMATHRVRDLATLLHENLQTSLDLILSAIQNCLEKDVAPPAADFIEFMSLAIEASHFLDNAQFVLWEHMPAAKGGAA